MAPKIQRMFTSIGRWPSVFIDNRKSAVKEVHDGRVDFRFHQFPIVGVIVNLKQKKKKQIRPVINFKSA